MKIYLMAFIFLSGATSFADSTMLYTVAPPPNVVRPPDLYIMRDFKRPNSKRIIEPEVDGPYIVTRHFIAFIKKSNLYIITDFDSLYKNQIASGVRNIFKGPDSELVFEMIKTEPQYKRELYYITDFVNFKKNFISSEYVDYTFQF